MKTNASLFVAMTVDPTALAANVSEAIESLPDDLETMRAFYNTLYEPLRQLDKRIREKERPYLVGTDVRRL